MSDPDAKRFNLRDIGIIVSIALAIGSIIHNASTSAANSKSFENFQELRTAKVESRVDGLEQSVNELRLQVTREGAEQRAVLRSIAQKVGADVGD